MTDTETARLHDEILTGKAEIAKLRDLLTKENKRANQAIDREETAEQAAQWRAAADVVEAMNEGCGQRKPCASCDAREDAADALRDTARRLAAETATTQTQAAGPVCICGHPEEQHFEDVCQTCGCGDYLEPQDAAEVIARWRQAALKVRAGERAAVLREAADQYAKLTDQNEAYDREQGELDADARLRHEVVRDVVAGLRRMADETATTETHARQEVDVDTLARLMCDADVHVNNGDYPGWDDLSKTPGLGQDEVRKAARYLMARLHITQRQPAAGARQDEPVVTVHTAPDLSPAASEALGALVDVAKQQAACDFEHPHPEHPCGRRTTAARPDGGAQ